MINWWWWSITRKFFLLECLSIYRLNSALSLDASFIVCYRLFPFDSPPPSSPISSASSFILAPVFPLLFPFLPPIPYLTIPLRPDDSISHVILDGVFCFEGIESHRFLERVGWGEGEWTHIYPPPACFNLEADWLDWYGQRRDALSFYFSFYLSFLPLFFFFLSSFRLHFLPVIYINLTQRKRKQSEGGFGGYFFPLVHCLMERVILDSLFFFRINCFHQHCHSVSPAKSIAFL